MKKLIIILLFILFAKPAFAQLNADSKDKLMWELELGVDQTIMNNGAFVNWAQTNYDRNVKPGFGINGGFAVYYKKIDGGFQITGLGGYNFTNFYAGLRLTHLSAKVSSYLNLGNFYYRKKSYNQALKYYNQSQALFRKLSDSVNLIPDDWMKLFAPWLRRWRTWTKSPSSRPAMEMLPACTKLPAILLRLRRRYRPCSRPSRACKCRIC